MSFPTTVGEMQNRGYKHLNESDCKGCGGELSWWETPRGKKIPMDAGTANVHWESCPKSEDFRTSQGENIVVNRVSTGNCAFDGDEAVIQTHIGRNKTMMCASHANQLFIKLKNSAKKGGGS